MGKIDVSYTAKPDPLGRRLFLDTETGLHEWEVLPDYAVPAFANPALTGATEEYHMAKSAAIVDAPVTEEEEEAFKAIAVAPVILQAIKEEEAARKPTKRRKASEGDK